MSVAAKICGLNNAASVRTAVSGGARFVGFVFYPPSPRAVTPDQVRALAALVPPEVKKVGLFVDADDATIATAVAAAKLDMLQLHGDETPARVMELKRRTGLAAMKVLKIGEAADLDAASSYRGSADWLMFDARPPKGMIGALPGGNAVTFDWTLLASRNWPMPWMLAGGLDAANLARAVTLSGARTVDVSSGVETAPGKKDPAKIRAFLASAAAL
ncbi:MAG: phosphoribosylanthranilate isomerase [Alphaproteobacteria bacterium]|nr:phosphoribosylanthranilate isomerase [Alphaproteobacteria bacterium]